MSAGEQGGTNGDGARDGHNRTSGALLRVGASAPAFELPDQHGAAVSARRLCHQGTVALIFFPFAHTSVCTDELREVAAWKDDFDRRGVTPVAISCDSMFTLRVLADAEALPFRLLSDFWPHGRTASTFGVLDDERGCALRATFLLGRNGVVRWRTVNALPDPRSLADLFRYLDGAPLEVGRPA